VQEAQSAYQQTKLLAHELGKFVDQDDLHIVWLAPNADGGSGEIVRALDELQETFGAALHRIVHLPRDDYLAALRHADLLIGNSSSGIIEAASLGTPVVNIGNRQRARERNVNTLDCPVESEPIRIAIGQALSRGRFVPANRYGDGHAAERIVELLATQPIRDDLLDKINTY
jgi:GDP/UDP-N,N'-diacetylbacillosamine 2-epimerase (hydrolysing)